MVMLDASREQSTTSTLKALTSNGCGPTFAMLAFSPAPQVPPERSPVLNFREWHVIVGLTFHQNLPQHRLAFSVEADLVSK